jgi:predicted ATPase
MSSPTARGRHSSPMNHSGASSAVLLERASELARLEEAVVAAMAGKPRVVLVEGPAGIGKTELLRACSERAEEAGMRSLASRGGELERELGLGVARQLFEPLVGACERSGACRAPRRAAAQAAALFGFGQPDSAPLADEYASQSALYWLCVRLAERSPLTIVVDDLHWCDATSLRWLAYLVRRLEDLPILLAAARRTGEAGADRACWRESRQSPESASSGPRP